MALIARFARVVILTGTCLLAVTHVTNPTAFTQGKAARTTPADVLRSAQTIFIRTETIYFKPAALEQALLNREEFERWNLAITREEAEADLIIEVDRKLFTNIFVYNVLAPRAKMVVTGGKIGSLGGSVEGQIADSFIKKLKRVR
jgi:membrane glycosyltransferase